MDYYVGKRWISRARITNTNGIVTVRVNRKGEVSGPLFRVGSEAVDIVTIMRLQREMVRAIAFADSPMVPVSR